MRRTRKKKRKLTARKSPSRLTSIPKERLRSLEEKVTGLEARLQYVEANLGIHPPIPEEERKKKPGPTPYPDEILFETRDRYIDWLEYYWPDLRPRLFAATGRNPAKVEEALKKCAGPENHWTPTVWALMESAAQLVDFVQSKRFRRKPPKLTVATALNGRYEDAKRMKAAARLPTRQIANAMAGVPSLDWRTSLDRCSANPSRMLVGKRTEEYYRKVYGVPAPKKTQGGSKASEGVPKSC
jgi:hypothetical protein